MTETLEKLEGDIRNMSSQIFALHEKRNTDWRKLSKDEKYCKNAYMTERLTHSIEWQNLTASILIPVFKYAKIKFHKYQKNNSYSEKLMETLQDCLLCFDESKDIDFIHYLNKSLKNMFSTECKKQNIHDKLGGMSHIDKDRADKTIAGQGKNLSAENVKDWMNQYVLREHYMGQDGKKKSWLEEIADDENIEEKVMSHNDCVMLLEKIEEIKDKKNKKSEFSDSDKAIITHYLFGLGFKEEMIRDRKFFSETELIECNKNQKREQLSVTSDYGLDKSSYNQVIKRMREKVGKMVENEKHDNYN